MLRRFLARLVVIVGFSAFVAPRLSSNGSELVIHAHPAGSVDVAFSADGRQVASAGNRGRFRILGAEAGGIIGEVKIWDASSGKIRAELPGIKAAVTSVAFSPDGKLLAAGRPMANISLYAVPGGSLASTLRGHELSDFGGVWALAFSPNGSSLASAGADYTIRLWDRTQNESLESRDSDHQTLKGHTGLIRAIAFAPDGERLASASNDNTVRIWCLVDAREPSN